jgi:hypothetical protein
MRTINAAAAVVQPGDTVVIHTGVYREQVSMVTAGTADKPIVFEAAPAANVVVTGADRITNWTKVPGPDNVYFTPWPYVFVGYSPLHAHPDDDEHRLIGRCEQVFVTGYALRQVLSRDHMDRGTFFVDEAAKRLYAWAANNAELPQTPIEASVRTGVWQNNGKAYIHVRGIRFRYAANAAQAGAAEFGPHNVAEDCIFERTNGSGAVFGAGAVARRCVFQDNGQLGFGVSGADNLLITHCLVRNNNIKQFDRGWEAGGDKICFSKGVVIEYSQFVDNRGSGVWFDISNRDCTVRNCLIANNEDAGIFDEISYGLHVHDNVIVGNGFSESPGDWGAQAGVCLSSSPGSVVERNLIVGNREGFDFREQDRTTPNPRGHGKDVWVWNHDETIRHNVIAYNRDAQTWGWFDTGDNRNWPSGSGASSQPTGKAPANIAAPYLATDDSQAPKDLSLEKLRLTLAENYYAVADSAELLHWGVTWRRNKGYTHLEDVQRELGLEKGSVTGEFPAADFETYDFRLPAGISILRMGCYPQGEVPGVKLGTRPVVR